MLIESKLNGEQVYKNEEKMEAIEEKFPDYNDNCELNFNNPISTVSFSHISRKKKKQYTKLFQNVSFTCFVIFVSRAVTTRRRCHVWHLVLFSTFAW